MLLWVTRHQHLGTTILKSTPHSHVIFGGCESGVRMEFAHVQPVLHEQKKGGIQVVNTAITLFC